MSLPSKICTKSDFAWNSYGNFHCYTENDLSSAKGYPWQNPQSYLPFDLKIFKKSITYLILSICNIHYQNEVRNNHYYAENDSSLLNSIPGISLGTANLLSIIITIMQRGGGYWILPPTPLSMMQRGGGYWIQYLLTLCKFSGLFCLRL